MNVDKLKEQMLKYRVTQRELAEKLGISESTFRRKLKGNGFGLLDASIMIEVLNIENPEYIFFEDQLT